MLRFHHYIPPLENHPVKNVTFGHNSGASGPCFMCIAQWEIKMGPRGAKQIKQGELLEAEAVRKITSSFHDYVHLFNLIAFLKGSIILNFY